MSYIQDKVDKIQGRLAETRRQTEERLTRARVVSRDLAERARAQSGEVYETTREYAGEAYRAGRNKARELPRHTRDAVERHPLAFLGGAIVLGALIGSLLPKRHARRQSGSRAGELGATARRLADAAAHAGREQIEELDWETANASQQFQNLVQRAKHAAIAAGDAAAETLRKKP